MGKTYVVSNIHGEYKKFVTLLEKIRFCDDDLMYVLGDMVDIGNESMELLCDLSVRTNVYAIAGEHDRTAYKVLSEFQKYLKSGKTPSPAYIETMKNWTADGGQTTLDGFLALDAEMKEGVLEYLEELASYEVASVGGKKYLLVHSGIDGFSAYRDLDDYPNEAFIGFPLDMSKEYYSRSYVVVGHRATPDAKIERVGKNIAIDCGAARGGVLGCLRLDDGAEFYV